jgi:hypothetical protein
VRGGSRAIGVRLKSGETIAADLVAANVDPRRFALDLLGEATLGPAIANKVKHYQWGQSFFAVYAALDGPVAYRAGAGADRAAYVHAAGQLLDQLAVMFAQCRAGLLPERPMLGIINEAAMDPTRAPKGKGLIKLVAHFVPYRVRGDAAGTIAGTDWDADQGGLRRSHHCLGHRGVSSRAQGPHRRAIGAVAGRYGTAHQKRRARQPTSMEPICPTRSAPCGRSPSLAPIARRLQMSISVVPAAIPAPASPSRRDGMRRGSFAAILVSASRAETAA